MDMNLNNCWKSAARPFDNMSLCLNGLVEIGELREAIRSIVTVLNEKHKDQELLVNDDWHEHDGFITQNRKTTWHSIKRTIKSNELLYESREGGLCVYTLVFNEDRDFALRYYVLDEDDDEEYPVTWGDFTLSGETELLEEICTRLPTEILEKVKYQNSFELFSKLHAKFKLNP